MNIAIIIGRAGSSGFKHKNLTPIVGRPLMAYPIMAAKSSPLIDKVFLSTDSHEMAEMGRQYGAEYLPRPAELATHAALSEDAFRFAYRQVAEKYSDIESVMLGFCNGATITPGFVTQAIEVLRQEADLDSVVSVSKYNMWSPLRARRIADNGRVVPFVDAKLFANANCDRDSQGDCYFVDCSLFVVRPRCFDYEKLGEPPFRWIGRQVHPLVQWGGLDVDYEWQMGQVEFWLRKHGFSEKQTPYGDLAVKA